MECYRLAGKTVEMESLKASIEAFGAGPCLGSADHEIVFVECRQVSRAFEVLDRLLNC